MARLSKNEDGPGWILELSDDERLRYELIERSNIRSLSVRLINQRQAAKKGNPTKLEAAEIQRTLKLIVTAEMALEDIIPKEEASNADER